jgi:hypothetical protein
VHPVPAGALQVAAELQVDAKPFPVKPAAQAAVQVCVGLTLSQPAAHAALATAGRAAWRHTAAALAVADTHMVRSMFVFTRCLGDTLAFCQA